MKSRQFTSVLVLSLLLVSIGAPLTYAKGVTKIAPTEAEPPHPFNVIDTAERRLVEGSVAVFVLDGVETVIPLDTHKPWNTAKGMLPEGMGGGEYDVYVRTPEGDEFYVGMFNVIAPVAPPTQYTLTVNIVGNGAVTLNPPGGVYDEGTVVELTASADPDWSFVWWSGDLSGYDNPETITMDGDRTVAATFMENTQIIPYIIPPAGEPGAPFTIYDPRGRMTPSTVAIFYLPGTDPAFGTIAPFSVVSSDGRTLTGNVPGSASPQDLYFVSVRPSFTLPALFNVLPFLVTASPVTGPVIVPPYGPPGQGFIIYDPLGRIQQGDIVLFYVEGTDPLLGTPVTEYSVMLSGTYMLGTVPIGLVTGNYYVSVRPPGGDPRFPDLTFYVWNTLTQYTLTVNIVGNGAVTLNPPGGVYDEGTEVTLTAVADSGWVLTGWGGDLSGTENPETIIMDSDKTVTATFTEGIPLPYITPPIGEPGSPFTIYDPGGRMKSYDVVLFYPAGTDPSLGNLASNVVVSTDGRVLTGNVAGAANWGYHYVTVRPSITLPSEFNDLPFVVAGSNIVEPIIVPNRGGPGYQFIIYDPQGRMQQGDLAVFYLESTDPMLGNTAQNVVVSEDGKTMTGFVPGAAQRQTQQYVSVRPTIDALSRFNDLAFYVS